MCESMNEKWRKRQREAQRESERDTKKNRSRMSNLKRESESALIDAL